MRLWMIEGDTGLRRKRGTILGHFSLLFKTYRHENLGEITVFHDRAEYMSFNRLKREIELMIISASLLYEALEGTGMEIKEGRKEILEIDAYIGGGNMDPTYASFTKYFEISIRYHMLGVTYGLKTSKWDSITNLTLFKRSKGTLEEEKIKDKLGKPRDGKYGEEYSDKKRIWIKNATMFLSLL